MSTSSMYLQSTPPSKPRPTAATISTDLLDAMAGSPVASSSGDIGGALTSLLRTLTARNTAVRVACADAKRAGLIAGHCDPLSSVITGTEPVAPTTRTRAYIDVGGRRYIEESTIETARAALTYAIEHAGLNLTVTRTGKAAQ